MRISLVAAAGVLALLPIYGPNTPACEYEDASGPHDAPICRWEAGPGGQSFTALTLFGGHRVVFVFDNGRIEAEER